MPPAAGAIVPDALVILLAISNLILVAVNVACLISLVWARYCRAAKHYDRSIRVLAEKQGEWFVNFVIERELTKLFKCDIEDLKYIFDAPCCDASDSGDVELVELDDGASGSKTEVSPGQAPRQAPK